MHTSLVTIGRVEEVNLPLFGFEHIPARVDTGAKTSAIWATNIREKDGVLYFALFAPKGKHYTGEIISTKVYAQRAIMSSSGHLEVRYAVKLQAVLKGRKINTTFTLANRSNQVYPILIGRNMLRGKFMVDVRLGTPLLREEKAVTAQKQAVLAKLVKRKDT